MVSGALSMSPSQLPPVKASRRVILEHAALRALALRLGSIARAQVAGTALGQRHRRFQAGGLEEIRDITLDQLRLQRHRAGADHQLLLAGQRDRHARGEVAQALADAGRRLDPADATAFRQRTRHHADHLALRAAGGEAGGIGLQRRVRLADRVLQGVIERARSGDGFGHAGKYRGWIRPVIVAWPATSAAAGTLNGAATTPSSGMNTPGATGDGPGPSPGCHCTGLPRSRSRRTSAHTSSTTPMASTNASANCHC
ncbi:hypothetical protein G6F22_015329 [Rhizopus arrhizus]|nr:hypothetical protein G6F22_015329 [Rhizopus arrhizus]